MKRFIICLVLRSIRWDQMAWNPSNSLPYHRGKCQPQKNFCNHGLLSKSFRYKYTLDVHQASSNAGKLYLCVFGIRSTLHFGNKKLLSMSVIYVISSEYVVAKIYMSHFAYACKMRYPLNLVFESLVISLKTNPKRNDIVISDSWFKKA